jgi:hypothetical protein
MRVPAWLWLVLVLLALSLALLLAPSAFEGPVLLRLDRRHAVTGTDLLALLVLLGGAVVLLAGFRRTSRQTAPLPVPGAWLFVAGLALGLAAAARFPYLRIQWPLAVILLGLLVIVAVARAVRL